MISINLNHMDRLLTCKIQDEGIGIPEAALTSKQFGVRGGGSPALSGGWSIFTETSPLNPLAKALERGDFKDSDEGALCF
jgi:hypothetical protein